MNSTESIPQVWDDERDSQFFRITASLFTPSYCYGASTLLASYDADDEFTTYAATAADDAPAPSATAEASSELRSRTNPARF